MDMAQTNGWAVISSPTTSDRIGHEYMRCTELRRVKDNDIYQLATILDVNGCWRKLMCIIPKHLDAQACSAPGALNYKEIVARVGLKYTAREISLIDGAAERLSAGQSISQVMIDEWKTSGRLNERPTIGVLLQLLVQAEIYSAADFVALQFLNEPKPQRPDYGPAANISLDLCSEDLSEDMVVDDVPTFQPTTSEINAAAVQVRTTGMNLDYFDKHMVRQEKSLPQQLENGTSSAVPVRPPRTKPSTLQSKEVTNNVAPTATNSVAMATNTPNVPNLSILNASSNKLPTTSQQMQQPQNIPNLSIFNGSSEQISMTTRDTNLEPVIQNGSFNAGTSAATSPNVPLITILIENNSGEISTATSKSAATESAQDSNTIINNLPAISALNLNTSSGLQALGNGHIEDNNSSGTEDEDDDDDDDDGDVSLPNLSNSDNQTSNNDSSLTTVTGTSGENSFELTNDSSSTSNDSNIPNLSELQQ